MANGVWPWAAALLVIAATQGTATTITSTTTTVSAASGTTTSTDFSGLPVTLVSDGTQPRPHCSWLMNWCTWNSATQLVCAQKLCQASGYLGGTYVSASNNPCNSGFINDNYMWFYLTDTQTYYYGSQRYKAAITASCSNTTTTTTQPPTVTMTTTSTTSPAPVTATSTSSSTSSSSTSSSSTSKSTTTSSITSTSSTGTWSTTSPTSSTTTVSATTSRTVSVTTTTTTFTATASTTVTCPPGTAGSDAAGCAPACPSGYMSDATTPGCLPLLATVLRALKDPTLSAASDNVGTTTWNVTADRLPPLVYPSTVLEYAADVAMTSAALVPNSACGVRWQPAPSGGLLLVEPWNGMCASKLNTSTVASNVERRGFVGVFLLVSSPELGNRQRVGSWVIPVTLRLARATTAMFDGIAVWSSTALPAQTFAMTSLSSSLQVYNSTQFAKKVLTPFYKDGDTVYAEHDLDADGAALNVTVVQLWLSTYADGRDVAVNLTSSLSKYPAPYGSARIAFVAKACRYCFLQSLAQVSAPGGRRLADAKFSYANLAVDIGGSTDSTGVRVVMSNTQQGEAIVSATTTPAPRTVIMTARAGMVKTAGGALLLALLCACLASSA